MNTSQVDGAEGAGCWTLLSEADRLVLDAADGWLLLGSPAEALAELLLLPHIVRNHPDFLLLRCRIAERMGDWSLVAEVAERLIAAVPEEIQAWLMWAHALERVEGPRAAFGLLLKQCNSFQNNHWFAEELAQYAFTIGKPEEFESYRIKANCHPKPFPTNATR